ncbi:uncharacterized protein CEXT_620551 [Caerostris extrusa]|uniref:Uncharacterized protein n=1 Tax=Caerostris extrusa TaxID=172846 RepID=A0AAV4RNL7_CAEEX|nr:uncharacterized protein CEXT_620551 [Caerostris extrusa]
MEIMMWGFDHCEIVSGHFSSVKLWPDFQWKQQGRIDYLETAKALIQNENICPTERFILACNYCLEDDVHALWNKIPRDLQNRIALANLSPIIQLWIGWIMRGERLDWSQVVPACRRARSTFGATYKPVGLRMFAQHLTPEDTRQCVILSIERRVMHYDDLYYFFKKMSTEEQIKLMEDHAFRVMKSFLHWPLQNFFMRMIDSIWIFLSEEQFRDMLHVIICQVILKGWRDFDYLMLLEVFWNKSPPAYKRFVEKDPVYKLVTGLKDTVKIPWKKLSSIKCNCHSKPHILYIE